MQKKMGFGGGCHWCTEAVFASLKGVKKVEQGWISSIPPNEAFSEAVIVEYDPCIISVKDLVSIHLYTHSATANHSMRPKYRSAVYWFNAEDEKEAANSIADIQTQFDQPIITEVLPFAAFRLSVPEQLNYYYANPKKPFCQLYINPKIQLLRNQFSKLVAV